MKRIILSIIIVLSLLVLVNCDIFETEHTHEFGEWTVIKEATCTEDGSRTRSCSCGESETESVSATGHTEEILAAYPATCTESGLTEGKKCTVCGETTVEQEEILVLKHDYKYTEVIDENNNIATLVVCQRENCGHTSTSTAGLYDKDNNLIASWADLINDYGLNELSDLGNIIKENESLTNGLMLFVDNSISDLDLAIFEYCPKITKVIIPSSVTSITNTSIESCAYLKNITVDENNECYKSIDGNLYDKEGITLIRYASGRENKDFYIPDGVEKIEMSAMMYSPYLEKLYIPNSVTLIEKNAFSYCSSLANVYFSGTTEQWKAIEETTHTEWWIDNHIIIHFDGKMQFCESSIWESGNGSLGRFKYVVDGDKIYINNVLYEKKVIENKLEHENEEKIISYFESKNDERVNVLKEIFATDNCIILQTDDTVLFHRILIHRFENTWYFLYLLPDNYIYHIGSAIINLEF